MFDNVLTSFMIKGPSSVIHEVIHFSTCLYIVFSPMLAIKLTSLNLVNSVHSVHLLKEKKLCFVLPNIYIMHTKYKLIYT